MAENSLGRGNSSEVEMLMCHLANQVWINPGNMRYILSVLRAQL